MNLLRFLLFFVVSVDVNLKTEIKKQFWVRKYKKVDDEKKTIFVFCRLRKGLNHNKTIKL